MEIICQECNNVFAVYSKDEKILENSSSGGIFYHIAKEIIKYRAEKPFSTREELLKVKKFFCF